MAEPEGPGLHRPKECVTLAFADLAGTSGWREPGAPDTIYGLQLNADGSYARAPILLDKDDLELAGGKMTGAINMDNHKISGLPVPSSDQDAATKQYVDQKDAGSLKLTGGVMMGPISLSVDPKENAHTASKGYVDWHNRDKLEKGEKYVRGYALALAGGAMTGSIEMSTKRITGLGDPLANQDAATAAYVLARAAELSTVVEDRARTMTEHVRTEVQAAKDYAEIRSLEHWVVRLEPRMGFIHLGQEGAVTRLDNMGKALVSYQARYTPAGQPSTNHSYLEVTPFPPGVRRMPSAKLPSGRNKCSMKAVAVTDSALLLSPPGGSTIYVELVLYVLSIQSWPHGILRGVGIKWRSTTAPRRVALVISSDADGQWTARASQPDITVELAGPSMEEIIFGEDVAISRLLFSHKPVSAGHIEHLLAQLE